MDAAAIPTRKRDGHETGPRSLMYGAEEATFPDPALVLAAAALDTSFFASEVINLILMGDLRTSRAFPLVNGDVNGWTLLAAIPRWR